MLEILKKIILRLYAVATCNGNDEILGIACGLGRDL